MPAALLRFPDLQVSGATVEVRVIPPAKPGKSKAKPPAPFILTALIDTGSSATVLKRGLPAFLGLRPIGNAYVHTASTTNVLCDEFAVTFMLQDLKIRATALELPLNTKGIDCLIGRDILAGCVMTYVGPENLVVLSA